MKICEVLIIVTFIMVTIIAINQYFDSEMTKLCDVLQLTNILPCDEIKVFKGGKRLTRSELIQNINSPVKAHEFKNGILYIVIY